MSNIAPYEVPRILPAVTLPAGTYIIGDPSYTISDADWLPWLNAADFRVPDRRHVLAAHIDGLLAVGVSTAYGDGEYVDQYGQVYGVDAGLIGAVPLEVAEHAGDDMPWNRCRATGMDTVGIGVQWTFFEPVLARYDDGVIRLGDLRIDTTEEF